LNQKREGEQSFSLFAYKYISMKYSKWLPIALFFLYTQPSFAQNFDIDLLKQINGHETAFKNDFFKAVGQSVTVVNIAAPLGILTAGLVKHDLQLQKKAAYMVGGYILSAAVTQGLKRTIQRQRPFEKYSFIVKRDDGGSYSFPSGHTSAAFYAATSLSILYPKWYVIVPSMLWASTAGYGRMYQGVHYPTDVLAGAVVGAASAWVTYKAQQWVNKKKANKIPSATPAAL
jgi:membrane-associated phospholipid phosphatase